MRALGYIAILVGLFLVAWLAAKELVREDGAIRKAVEEFSDSEVVDSDSEVVDEEGIAHAPRRAVDRARNVQKIVDDRARQLEEEMRRLEGEIAEDERSPQPEDPYGYPP